jgi:alpha-tubulin suppressor-like RCC1 family protein
VAGITAGGHHNCATLFSSTAWCWGANSSGQLGNGSTDNSSTPQQVTRLSNVTAVAAGNRHSCARLTDGTVSCWGENRSGELGDGTILATFQPVKVVGIP